MVRIERINFKIPNKNGKGYVGKWWGKYVLPKFKVLEPQTIEVALIDKGRYYFAYKIKKSIVSEIQDNSICFYKIIEANENIIDKNEIFALSFSYLYMYELFDLNEFINQIDMKINNIINNLNNYIPNISENDHKYIIKKLIEFADIQKNKLKEKFNKIEQQYKKYLDIKQKFIEFVKQYVPKHYNVNYSVLDWKEDYSSYKSSETYPDIILYCPICLKKIGQYKNKNDVPHLFKHCGTSILVDVSRFAEEDEDWGLHKSDGVEYYTVVSYKWIDGVKGLDIYDYLKMGGDKELLLKFYEKIMGEKWELVNSEADFECKFEEYVSSKGRKLKVFWDYGGINIEGDLESWEIKLFSKYF